MTSEMELPHALLDFNGASLHHGNKARFLRNEGPSYVSVA